MLDSGFYDRLSRLQLAMAHKSSLNMSGNRKSVHKGISAEFSDFREYMPGDDLRRLDWNVYARLDRMYIREYMEEKEAVVSVLLDTSASMDYGKEKKSVLAEELVAVVSFLALNNMDRVAIFDMKEMSRGIVLGGGRNAFTRVIAWLNERTYEGECDMLAALKKMPMDDTLMLCAIDLSGRPYFVYDCEYSMPSIGDMDTEMVKDFFYAVSYSAEMNLHIKKLDGFNNHHIAEATFKAFAKALDIATTVDTRIEGVLSTKGSL